MYTFVYTEPLSVRITKHALFRSCVFSRYKHHNFCIPDLRNHARNRIRLEDSAAERMLAKIGDGNTSDISLSDDEKADVRPELQIDYADAEPGSSAATQPAATPPEDEEEKESDKNRKKTAWRAGNFVAPDTSFQPAPSVLNTVLEPCEYFSRYFNEEMFEEFARCTNLCALQSNGILLKTTANEMKTFFGMLMIMGTLKFPRIRMYWQAATKIPSVSEAMPVNRFFKLRSALHITEPTPPPLPTGKFWKVQPVIDAVRRRCQELPPVEINCIDEQMIPFTGHVAAKQFMKNKPNPEGIKLFIRCSSDGVAHDFELYQGKGTGTSLEHKHLGLGGSIVMRLIKNLPKLMNFKCYFDNYFTSIGLLRELKALGIWATGTIRANRLQGCPLKTDKQLKQEGRGSFDAKVTEEGDVTVVRWQDNGVVNVASTFVGVGQPSNVRRWSDSSKKHVDIEYPELIQRYNASMGGVDKMDFSLSLYPIRQRTNKWPVRVISHFVSFAVINSWQEYLQDAKANCFARSNVMDLLTFQNNIGLSLILLKKPTIRKRGRPSVTETREPPRKVHNTEPRPINAIRYDSIDHWPAHATRSFAQRCKMKGCTSRTRIRCRKCNVFLCLSATNDCFYNFHNQ